MIRTLHEIDPSTINFPLPFCGDFPWWDFSKIIGETDFVDEVAGRALRQAIASRAGWYSQARTGPLVLCHGDVHPGNVMVDAHGPILIDWDLLCVGPRSWDHAPLMSLTRRWGGEPGVYEAFASGYGTTMDDTLAHTICELRLVAATLMRLRAARDRPDNGEAQRRLAYWRNEPDAPMWRAV
jgi:aminoglycoside phosphotransferase (APT) family kinase protein